MPVFDEQTLLVGIFALIFACVGFLVLAATASGTAGATRARLRQYIRQPEDSTSGTAGQTVLRDQRASTVGRIDSLLRGNALAQDLTLALTAARIPFRVGEFVLLMVVCGALAAYLVQMQTGSIIAAVLAGAGGLVAPRLYLNHRKEQRIKAIESQIVDLLGLCSNALRTGWGFLQALEQAAEELPAPISEEIRQVLEEVSLGATPEEALLAFQRRIPSYDLELMVTAVLIQRRVGGNLAEMLGTIAHTIRGRIELMQEMRTITAESRMSTWILTLLPVVLLGIFSIVQPDYIAVLFNEPRGRMILMAAVGLELTGIVVLRRLAQINV